jgi:hypothetical protein
MSYSYRFTLVATIRPTPPREFRTWIESCISGESPAPEFEVPEVASAMVEDAAWLLAQAGSLTVAWQSTEATSWELAVHPSNVRDDASAAVYGLPLLVAPYCEDGTIAVLWTDMPADVDPTHFFVQDGVAYVGHRNGLPLPAVEGNPGAYVWRLGIDTPTVKAVARFGVAEPETFVRRAEESGQPALARHLLARSVVRALGDLDLDEERLQHAARLGAELVLNLIDAGGDPLMVKDSPGWQLQEVGGQDRYGSLPARPSGRAIARLVDALAEVALESLDAGPKRLVEGETITVLAALPLVARGPMIDATDEVGRRYGSGHRLDLEVPVGSQLKLTKVYDKGHAECRPLAGDFSAWIRPGGPNSRRQPAEPVAGAEEYTLGWIRPDDEGRLFERRR